MRRARYGFFGVGLMALVSWVGVAFACTASVPQVYSILPESAAPGSTVVVRGQSVASPSAVEIRWNGVGGRVLAAATPANGDFSVPVQIPEVAPGIYSLMLVTSDGLVGRTAFEVTGAAASAPANVAQLWPSLGSEASFDTPESSGPSSAGMALLAIGLVGLFAGSAVAVVTRRRALVNR